MVEIEILGFLILEIFLPLLIVGLMHYKLSKYPKPLRLLKNKRKVIGETLIFWALVVIVLTLIVLSNFSDKLIDPTLDVLLSLVFIMAVPYVLIPVLYLKLVRGWSWRDFGFRMPLPKRRSIIIFSILLFMVSGLLPLFNPKYSPLPILIVLFAIWQPAFIEEFFFRGVLQGNLERAVGQNKAWIYGGLLFGLIHVPFNYYFVGIDLVPGLLLFFGQVTSAWMFGILYMKTRSLWPGVFAHFLTNGTLASIMVMIF